MKKLAIIIPVIMLAVGCVVIDGRYTGRRVAIEAAEVDEYYDYAPARNYYYDPYYSPYWYPSSWIGLSWWNPFWYYGWYNSYWGYWGGYYGYPYYYSYPYYSYPSRYGRRTVTKNQLKGRSTAGSSATRRIRSSTGRVSSSGSKGRVVTTRTRKSPSGTSRVVTRGPTVRSSGGRSVATSGRSGSSSRGSSGSRVKKK